MKEKNRKLSYYYDEINTIQYNIKSYTIFEIDRRAMRKKKNK